MSNLKNILMLFGFACSLLDRQHDGATGEKHSRSNHWCRVAKSSSRRFAASGAFARRLSSIASWRSR